jgi:tetratricopeptide (TPR) repeat protein
MNWRWRSLVLILTASAALGAESVADLLLRARQLHAERKLPLAEEVYLRALAAASDERVTAAIQVELGVLWRTAGRCADGYPSERAETLNILGSVYSARKDFRQAEVTLRAALQEAGEDERTAANALRHLGWVLIQGKRCPEAIECFRAALEINRRTMGNQHEVFPDRLREYSFAMRTCGQKDDAKRLKTQAEPLGSASARHKHTIDVNALRGR